MLRRIAPWGLGFFATVAVTATLFGSSWTYQDEQTELGHLEGPVPATLVLHREATFGMQCSGEGWTKLCWPGTERHQQARLDVGGEQPFSAIVPSRLTPLDRVELRADEDGSRFAFRKVSRAREHAWKLVFAGQHGTGYAFGRTASDDEGQPDWSSAPTFDEAAPRLFARADETGRRALVQDVEDTYGPRGVVELLLATVDIWPSGKPELRRRDGIWGEAADALPRGARRQLERRLAHRFQSERLSRNALLRTLRYIDLSDPANLDRMTHLLARRVGHRPDPRFGRQPLPDAIMLRALARHRPEAAGRLGCSMLAERDPAHLLAGGAKPPHYQREAELIAIVAGGTQCPAAIETAQALGIEPDLQAFDQAFDRIADQGRIRPRRDFFQVDRHPVRAQRLRRLLAAAAAAPAQAGYARSSGCPRGDAE